MPRAADVAELTERDQRGQLAHPIEAHQCAAAGLAAGELAQLALERSDLGVDRVDHRQRDLDPLARVGRQRQALQERAAFGGAQPLRGAADAVMKQRRLDALHPLGSFVDQRVSQPRPRAPLADVLGRDPGLRQLAVGEQLAQPAGVLAIGLGAPLATAQRARLDRLGQMRLSARRDQCVADEQPAGARFTATRTSPQSA